MKTYLNADYHSCDHCGLQDNFINLEENEPAICDCGETMQAVHSELLLSDSHGIYIPKIFAENYADQFGLTETNIKILSNPDNEWYWEEWHDVCTNKTINDENGLTWYLDQDGDLFARAFIDFEAA